MLAKAQLRWAGHVVMSARKKNVCPKDCRMVGFWKERDLLELNISRQEYVKVSLNNFDVDPDIWEELAGDRLSWQSLIAKGAIRYEKDCLTRAENKRRQRKTFSVSSSSTQHHVCADCGRTFRAPIGLFSHKRTHRGSADLTNNTST